MSAHTPGPWKRRWSHEARGDGQTVETGRICGARDVKIADLVMGPNVDADARLIAAAPDLLEALKDSQLIGMSEFLRLVRDFTEPNRNEPDMTTEQLHIRSLRALKAYEEARARMRAAIAKAEGQ